MNSTAFHRDRDRIDRRLFDVVPDGELDFQLPGSHIQNRPIPHGWLSGSQFSIVPTLKSPYFAFIVT